MGTQAITVTFDTDLTGELNEREIGEVHQIVSTLIGKGGLTGVRQGKTILHFDKMGKFMGVELQYWPWREAPNRSFEH